MTEAEWLSSEEPVRMLNWLDRVVVQGDDQPFGLPSQRKLRLFAAACWRLFAEERILNWKPGDPSGRGHYIDLRDSCDAAERVADGEPAPERGWIVLAQDARVAARQTMDSGALPKSINQAALIRDLAGNPFQPVTLMSGACGHCKGYGCGHCVHWLRPSIRGMARRIYEERDFSADALGVLADVLEDAGCDSEEVLRHLRRQDHCSLCAFAAQEGDLPIWCGECNNGRGWIPKRGPCVRGCHIIDLILGKE